MKHKKEIYEKMKRRDFGESMSDETKLKVLNFVERQLHVFADNHTPCTSDDPDDMCDHCNCWKSTRSNCS